MHGGGVTDQIEADLGEQGVEGGCPAAEQPTTGREGRSVQVYSAERQLAELRCSASTCPGAEQAA